MAALSGFFGQLAMLIAAIGLYGLVSYIASARQQELAGLTLVACGLVIGVPAALLMKFPATRSGGVIMPWGESVI